MESQPLAPDLVHLGVSLSLRAFCRADPALLVCDPATLGLFLLLRSAASADFLPPAFGLMTLELLLLVLGPSSFGVLLLSRGAARLGSGLLVPDVVQLGLLLLLQAMA